MIYFKTIISVTLLVFFCAPSITLPESDLPEFTQKPSFSVDAGLKPNLMFLNQQNQLQKTSEFNSTKGKALFLSFLVPGLGEYYSGHKTRAKVFFITEVLLWSTYAGFKIYENWIEDEYRVFATHHARIDTRDKTHKFFVNIGNYDNIYEYNTAKLNYRQLEDVYPASYSWDWDSDANRHDFKMMRIRADNANYRALFMLGTILVNHIVSAIDAVWVSRSIGDSDHQSKQSLNFHFDPKENFQQYRLVFTRSF